MIIRIVTGINRQVTTQFKNSICARGFIYIPVQGWMAHALTAQSGKMAHSFGDLRPSKPKQPYIDITRSMYPKLPFNLQSLISDVLQDAEGIEEQPKKNTRDTIIKGVQDSYSMSGEPVDAKATVANAKDKANKLKDKILESLKLNY
mgnify:CR=1 FL=1